MAKCILFQDGEMKGFLENEISVRKVINELSDFLVEELRKKSPQDIRIFRENIDQGICIYTQSIGSYINGTVNLVHTISWQHLPEYKFP